MECLGWAGIRIFDCLRADNRYREDRDTSRSEDPANFRQGALVVVDMLQDVRCIKKIIGSIAERQMSQIGLEIHSLGAKIRRMVDRKSGAYISAELRFRREMNCCFAAAIIGAEKFFKRAILYSVAAERTTP